VLAEMEAIACSPRESHAGKELHVYLKHYYNCEAGSVPWQEAAVNLAY